MCLLCVTVCVMLYLFGVVCVFVLVVFLCVSSSFVVSSVVCVL